MIIRPEEKLKNHKYHSNISSTSDKKLNNSNLSQIQNKKYSLSSKNGNSFLKKLTSLVFKNDSNSNSGSNVNLKTSKSIIPEKIDNDNDIKQNSIAFNYKQKY